MTVIITLFINNYNFNNNQYAVDCAFFLWSAQMGPANEMFFKKAFSQSFQNHNILGIYMSLYLVSKCL